MDKDSIYRMISTIETSRNEALSQDDIDEIERWQKSRALAQLVGQDGWEVLIDMLKSYVTDQIDNLVNADPGNRDEVLACHAVTYAVKHLYDKFTEDVANAVQYAAHVPESIKTNARKVKTHIPLENM